MTEELKFKPLYDNVIVEQDSQIDQSAGGIYLPDIAKPRALTGTVRAVGHGRMSSGGIAPLVVKVGDRVQFDDFAGTKIYIDGKEYLQMREVGIVGILEGDVNVSLEQPAPGQVRAM